MTNLLPVLFLQSNAAPSAGANAMAAGALIVWAVALLFFVAVGWKIFVKAGQPGWAAIVPIYNIIVLMKEVGKPAWWFVLMFIPVVNFVIAIIVSIELAKRFGKGVGFGLGLAFLGIIFAPILAFGSAQYQPAA